MTSPPPRRIVLDDTDSSITYDGPYWTNETGTDIGTSGPPYLNTLHKTTRGGTVSFAFNGTGVEILGTSIDVKAQPGPDPLYECFIDNTSMAASGQVLTENNVQFCGKENLTDGFHSVRIEVKASSSGQAFWLDRITYAPSASVPLDDKVLQLENADPIINYDEKWTSLGDSANMTTQTNSTARVDFFGISLSWVGFIAAELPHVQSSGTWSLDGATPQEFFIKAQGVDSRTLFNQFLFITPDVEPNHHSLSVTFHGSIDSAPLILDYLYIKNGTPISNGRSGVTGSPTSTATSTTMPSQGLPNDVHQEHSNKAGLIAGSTIGGLGFLLVVFAAFVFYRRWRIRRYETAVACNARPFQVGIWQTGNYQPHMSVKLNADKSKLRFQRNFLTG